MVPAARRASAYGIFTAPYGTFWMPGSALLGFLYDGDTYWTAVWENLFFNRRLRHVYKDGRAAS